MSASVKMHHFSELDEDSEAAVSLSSNSELYAEQHDQNSNELVLLRQSFEITELGIAKMKADVDSTRAAVQRLESESIVLKRSVQISAVHSNRTLEIRDVELQRLGEHNSRLETEILAQKKAQDLLLVEIQELEASYIERHFIQQSELKCLYDLNSRLQSELSEIRNEEKLKKEKAPTEAEVLQLRQQEKRLHSYSVTLSEKNNAIRRFSKQLAEEVQSARTMHPLKDYLALTEHELLKVELRLKKLPESSIDRLELEDALSQMLKQRDFLRSLIDASTQQLSEQATRILSMIEEGSLAGVPPLPPLASRMSS